MLGFLPSQKKTSEGKLGRGPSEAWTQLYTNPPVCADYCYTVSDKAESLRPRASTRLLRA